MIVPTDIAPIDYQKDTNQFIFTTAGYILGVDYEKQIFDLQTPDKLAYYQDFKFLINPPEWFDIIDFGLIEWVRGAVDWNNKKPRPKDIVEQFEFKVEGIIYKVKFNPRAHDFSILIPGKTIICSRDSITTDFPEIQFIDYGQLVTMITSILVGKMKDSNMNSEQERKLDLPVVFQTEKITIKDNVYEFGYYSELDMAFLMIPEREIQANLLTAETDAPELAEMHEGMLYEMIRSLVYDKSPSE